MAASLAARILAASAAWALRVASRVRSVRDPFREVCCWRSIRAVLRAFCWAEVALVAALAAPEGEELRATAPVPHGRGQRGRQADQLCGLTASGATGEAVQGHPTGAGRAARFRAFCIRHIVVRGHESLPESSSRQGVPKRLIDHNDAFTGSSNADCNQITEFRDAR